MLYDLLILMLFKTTFESTSNIIKPHWESVAVSVIQVIRMVEFEDGLSPSVLSPLNAFKKTIPKFSLDFQKHNFSSSSISRLNDSLQILHSSEGNP